MKRKLLILFCLALWSIAYTQNLKGIDSLKLALNLATTDSARFSLHFMIYREYVEFINDSALFHVEQQIQIAAQNNMKLAQADALETKGYVLQRFGRYAESLQTLNLALDIANNPEYEKQNWYPDSMGSPHVFRLRVLGYIQLDLGHVMGSINDIDKQIDHYKKAIRQAKEINNFELLGIVHLNLGYVYFYNLNVLDTAIQMQQIALASFQQAGHTKWLNSVYGALGDIYLRKNEYKLGLEYFHKAIQASYAVNNLENVFWCTHSLIDHFNNVQNKDSSMHYAQKMGDLVRRHTAAIPKNAGELYYILLSKTFTSYNQADSAYKYLNLAYILKDSSYQSQIKNLTDVQNLSFETKIRAEQLEKEKTILKNRIRQYSLLAGLSALILVALFLYRNNRQKQKTNSVLETTLVNLKSTQAQLIQSEKMASLGELTAGIAHEIQNPLNFVNNFSELNGELIDEIIEDRRKKIEERSEKLQDELIGNIKDNEEKINHHGKRAESIVKGMLEHSRKSTGVKEPIDINKLCDEFVRLSYHGLRAKDKDFNCEYKLDLDPNLPLANVVSQDIGRVLLNIINNAFQACAERLTLSQTEVSRSAESLKLESQEVYKPLVTLTTKFSASLRLCEIIITDNGPGIPPHIKDKIFQPFFTTKPTGQGTGLGLSLAYDIVKAHGGTIEVKSNYISQSGPPGGEIKVMSNENEGAEFIIQLPNE